MKIELNIYGDQLVDPSAPWVLYYLRNEVRKNLQICTPTQRTITTTLWKVVTNSGN